MDKLRAKAADAVFRARTLDWTQDLEALALELQSIGTDIANAGKAMAQRLAGAARRGKAKAT